MIKLYSYHRNSAGERVRIALNLKGVPYAYVSAPALGEAYRALNPQGLMPALDTDGRILLQSTAILEYLEERWPEPRLLPADPLLRAEARGSGQVIACEMHPLTVQRVRKRLEADIGAGEEAIEGWTQHWMAEGLATLEAMLARRERAWHFCFGDTPGWAELYLIPQLRNARRFGLDLADYPLLLDVEAHCVDLDAFQRGRRTSRTFPRRLTRSGAGPRARGQARWRRSGRHRPGGRRAGGRQAHPAPSAAAPSRR